MTDYERESVGVVLAIGCILFLLLAAFVRLPYELYEWLRICICGISIFGLVECNRIKETFWILPFAAQAILFNPLITIRMTRNHWKTANLISAVFLAMWVVRILMRPNKKVAKTGAA